jgi:hypothetical protein
MAAGEDLGLQPQSIHKLARLIRRSDHGLFNCVASVLDDAQFVHEVCKPHFLILFCQLMLGLGHAGTNVWSLLVGVLMGFC